MGNILSVVADICVILGFLVSLFVANTVWKIRRDTNTNKVNVSGNTKVGGDFTGRDKTENK
jgi:hypothetical protein